MMGVTTLSIPSMIMLRKAIKPKLLGIFIAICTVGIILVGYFFNLIQPLIILFQDGFTIGLFGEKKEEKRLAALAARLRNSL